jgi:type IV pilus assembly protein PilE
MRTITMNVKDSGFSLIELMIVVVIATILAAIAIPSYNSQIRKSRRTEAKTALADLASREERYFATQNFYTNDPVALKYVASGAWPVAIGNYYSISSVAVTQAAASPTATTPGTYTLQITPTAGSAQLKDNSCQTFQVDQTGKQTSLDSGGADSTATCWP